MSDLYSFIGAKIRELRRSYGGSGISQEVLAEKMKKTPNTISRWETASYKPTIRDLHKLATSVDECDGRTRRRRS